MARAIQLTPSITSYVHGPVNGSRLAIVATRAVGMPTAVFAYLVAPLQPGEAEAVAVFSHVCSPADLAEYPEGSPRPNAVPPWFRASSVDLLFRSQSQADEANTVIVDQVGVLVATLDRLDALEALPPVWLGTPP